MAGESAEQVARRQRERAERLMRSPDRPERGVHGELATGVILDTLRADGWVVFHDARWPGRPRAYLDHVVVGPGGIFVIDSKSWSGRIDIGQNTFWCRGSRQDQAVAAAGDAALAVAGTVSAPAAGVVRATLCFVRDEPLAGWCFDVMVCSTANLREMLVTRPSVLTPDQVRLASIELELGFKAAADVRTAPARAPRPPAPPTVPTVAARRRPSLVRPLFQVAALGVIALVALPLLPRLVYDLGREPVDDVTPVKAYQSCTVLRRDHPHGVGTAAAVNAVERSRRMPTADDRLYEVNASLDEDYDELVCERAR